MSKKQTNRQRAKTSRRTPAVRRSSRLGWRWSNPYLVIFMVICLTAFIGFRTIRESSAASSCSVSATLVNSCRPWLGAATGGYPQAASDSTSQFLYHEQRIGRQLDIVHTYHPVGSNTLSSTDTYFATRSGTTLFTNWKPTASWGDIASQNSAIDSMANSVKSLGSHKIFMTLYHEPENDVTNDGGNCTSVGYKGGAGTPAQYRAMWSYVESRFASDGVNNVVWVMDYMGYSAWDCIVPDLWPGNDLVDWVMFDTYSDNGGSGSFSSSAGRFYTVLTNDTDSAHAFTSKPWGLAEWGVRKGGASAEEAYYDQAKSAVDNNTYPRLKAYIIFDLPGPNDTSTQDLRVGYDPDATADPDKAAHYAAFADDPLFTDAHYTTPPPPPADTTAPSVSLTAPSNGAKVSGTVTVTGTAGDNVGVSSVALYVDGAKVATDTSSPYSFGLDTTKYSNANHSLVLHAYDAAGNGGQSGTVTITVDNAAVPTGGGGTPGDGGTGSSGNGQGDTVITVDSSSDKPVAVKGTLVITASESGASVEVSLDGKTQSSNAVNTTKLTNGTHTLTITENGKTVHQKIVIHNPWPMAFRNEIQAHPVAYTTGGSGSLALIVVALWIGRRWVQRWIWRARQKGFVHFGVGRIITPGRRK